MNTVSDNRQQQLCHWPLRSRLAARTASGSWGSSLLRSHGHNSSNNNDNNEHNSCNDLTHNNYSINSNNNDNNCDSYNNVLGESALRSGWLGRAEAASVITCFFCCGGRPLAFLLCPAIAPLECHTREGSQRNGLFQPLCGQDKSGNGLFAVAVLWQRLFPYLRFRTFQSRVWTNLKLVGGPQRS